MTPEPDPLCVAQKRENVDPEESIRPIPLLVAAVTAVMVAFGVLCTLPVRVRAAPGFALLLAPAAFARLPAGGPPPTRFTSLSGGLDV